MAAPLAARNPPPPKPPPPQHQQHQQQGLPHLLLQDDALWRPKLLQGRSADDGTLPEAHQRCRTGSAKGEKGVGMCCIHT